MAFGTYCITDQVMKAVELSSHQKQGLQLQIVDGWGCKEKRVYRSIRLSDSSI